MKFYKKIICLTPLFSYFKNLNYKQNLKIGLIS